MIHAIVSLIIIYCLIHWLVMLCGFIAEAVTDMSSPSPTPEPRWYWMDEDDD